MSISASQQSTKQHPMASYKAAILNEFDDNVVGARERHDGETINANVRVSFDNKEQTERKEDISSWSDMCRVCASVNDHIIPIFDAEGAEHELSNKIHKYLPIRVHKTDTLPVQLCYHCAATILAWHELLEGCLDAEKRLLQLQTEQNSREQGQTEYGENLSLLSEEPIDEPERPEAEKQVSSSIDREKEEKDNCGDSSIGDEASKRFDTTMETFKVFLETQNSDRRRRRLRIQVRNCTWNENRDTLNQDGEESTDEDPLRLVEETVTRRRDGHSKRTKKNEKMSAPKTSVPQETCNRRNDDAPLNLYKCNECTKVFRLKDSYIRHQRIHRDERPFTCHVCGKQFRDSGGLSRHLKDVHAKVKNFSCDICSKCFSSKATRDDHRRTHTGERPYACENCKKSFKSRACLYIHSKLHTDQFPYPCGHCEKKFRRRQEMLGHVSTHTGEKNYSCDVCSRRFRLKTELTRHKFTHSDEKPYICAKCGLTFRQNRYLNNHVKSRHSQSL